MKTLFAFVLSCVASLASQAQKGPSTTSAEGMLQQDLEVLVDGKSYGMISVTASDATPSANVNITNLKRGQHIVKLKPVQTEETETYAAVIETTPELPLSGNASASIFPEPGRIDIAQKQIVISLEEKDSIKVELYDNGFVDNDTVSIFRDNQPVLHDARLSGQPLTFYTSFEKGNAVQVLKMEARNLGTIAPNTALMIVTTRKAKYTVPLSGDLQKNAVVELILKQ